MTGSLWDTIAREAAAESPLWEAALRPSGERETLTVFSPLADERFALALESIYEGYLLHYGRPRLFAADDRDTGVLLGDYLYAHGLVRLAAARDADAVADLAELISLCAQLRAEGHEPAVAAREGAAWAATAAALGAGRGRLEDARRALRLDRDPGPLVALARDRVGDARLERALSAHRGRVE